VPAARLEELQEGLAKLQAEGVAEGLKAAKVQQAQADSQLKADTKAALAALEGLLSANGLAPADAKAYLGLELQSNARGCAKQGWGLTAARLEELQEGLAKLQAAGVAGGLKAAKVQQAQADAQRAAQDGHEGGVGSAGGCVERQRSGRCRRQDVHRL
jgi:hypothetical protein